MQTKVVIAGSVSLANEIKRWVDYWNIQENCIVLDYPKTIDQENFDLDYPKVHEDFFRNIKEADILFVANEDKNGVGGYIGYETFAELAFAVAQKLTDKRNIKIILAKMPSKEVGCYEEVVLWTRLGWIDETLEK